MLSGRLPSFLDSPGGSNLDGISADDNACFTRSFTCEWRGCLPISCLQLRPCLPKEFTSLPHWQIWWWQICEPMRKAQTTLKLESESFNPRLKMGMAWSQSEAWSNAIRSIRDFSVSDGADSSYLLCGLRYIGLSHSAWKCWFVGMISWPIWFFHSVQPNSKNLSWCSSVHAGIRDNTNCLEPNEEERKAGNATSEANFRPRPPRLTCRVHWFRAELSNCMFRIFRSSLSYHILVIFVSLRNMAPS